MSTSEELFQDKRADINGVPVGRFGHARLNPSEFVSEKRYEYQRRARAEESVFGRSNVVVCGMMLCGAKVEKMLEDRKGMEVAEGLY